MRVAEIQSMYVASGYRGDGLGEELVQRFRLWVRGLRAEHASVTAYAANEGAIRFYRRLVFGPRSITLEEDL